MKYLLFLLTPLLFSCQALATLDRLELQIGQQGVQLDVAMADGTTTKAELAVLKDGNIKMAATTEQLREDVEEGAATGAKMAGGVTGLGGMADLGIAALTAFLGVNAARDRKRRLRGEGTGTDAPQAAT